MFTAASETFNRKNINAGVDESIERFRPVVARAKEEKVRVRGYVSTAFGCPVRRGHRAGGRARGRAQAARPLGRRDLDRRHDRRRDAGGRLRRDRGALRVGRDARRARAALPRHARHRARQRVRRASSAASRRSTRRPADSAAVPTRRARPATSRPRTSSTCWKASGSTRASRSRAWSKRRGGSPGASDTGRRGAISPPSGGRRVDRLRAGV